MCNVHCACGLQVAALRSRLDQQESTIDELRLNATSVAAHHSTEIEGLRSIFSRDLNVLSATVDSLLAVTTPAAPERDVVATHYVNDSAEIPTDARLVKLAGARSRHRHNCSLAPGVEEGQRLTLIGFTWSAELANPHPNVQFARRCSHTAFGNEVRFDFCPLIYSPLSGG